MKTILLTAALGFGLAGAPALSQAQNVFVTNYSANTVAGFSTATGVPIATFSGGDADSFISFPIGITSDAAGNLYVGSINPSNPASPTTSISSILRIGAAGNIQTVVLGSQTGSSQGLPGTSLVNPKGVVFGPGNQLYVSNGSADSNSINNSFVGEANVGTGSFNSTYSGGNGSPVNAPYAITYDGSRYLYVNNGPVGMSNGSPVNSMTAISRIDTQTAGAPAVNLTLQLAASGAPTAVSFNSFNGMTFGPDGALYVTDAGQGNILRIANPDTGTSSITLFTGGIIGLQGLAFDPADPLNRLYFATDADQIRRVTPAGNVNTGFVAGALDNFTIQEADGSGPTFLAFSPIPEPSTYALFGVAGLVLTIGLLRRGQPTLRV